MMLPRIDPLPTPSKDKQFFCFIEKKNISNRVDNRYREEGAEAEDEAGNPTQ